LRVTVFPKAGLIFILLDANLGHGRAGEIAPPPFTFRGRAEDPPSSHLSGLHTFFISSPPLSSRFEIPHLVWVVIWKVFSFSPSRNDLFFHHWCPLFRRLSEVPSERLLRLFLGRFLRPCYLAGAGEIRLCVHGRFSRQRRTRFPSSSFVRERGLFGVLQGGGPLSLLGGCVGGSGPFFPSDVNQDPCDSYFT